MNDSCAFNEQLSLASSIVLSLWLSLTGLAAVIGNAVVLWLFYKHESLRTTSNRFLASLCVADLLAGLVVEPMYITIKVFAQPRKATILLKFNHLAWIHTTAATVFNLCCVSVNRFIAIRFPFRYQDVITKQKMLRSDYNGVGNNNTYIALFPNGSTALNRFKNSLATNI